jgi:hypothetical protein
MIQLRSTGEIDPQSLTKVELGQRQIEIHSLLHISTIPVTLLLLFLLPTTVVFGQTSPWNLFQQLCPTG